MSNVSNRIRSKVREVRGRLQKKVKDITGGGGVIGNRMGSPEMQGDILSRIRNRVSSLRNRVQQKAKSIRGGASGRGTVEGKSRKSKSQRGGF